MLTDEPQTPGTRCASHRRNRTYTSTAVPRLALISRLVLAVWLQFCCCQARVVFAQPEADHGHRAVDCAVAQSCCAPAQSCCDSQSADNEGTPCCPGQEEQGGNCSSCCLKAPPPSIQLDIPVDVDGTWCANPPLADATLATSNDANQASGRCHRSHAPPGMPDRSAHLASLGTLLI